MMAKLQVHNSLHIFAISNYRIFREFSTPCISFDILRDLSLPVIEIILRFGGRLVYLIEHVITAHLLRDL
jgi:hypothetical protein